jgi:hypothetical protein
MKHLLLFENYNQQLYKTAEEMCDYIREITPYEDDVPDYFLNMITTANAKFELKKVNIQDVISNDTDVQDYINSNDDRYEDADEFVPHWSDLDNPIVIFNNIVLDGYNRLLVKSSNDETEIDAWVSI